MENIASGISEKCSRRASLACMIIGLLCCCAATVCHAQNVPSDFTPGLQHVLNLSKGGMSDDFILTYITNSGTLYTLSDADIIYLHNQGVSDSVIKGLIQTAPTASTSQPPVGPPAVVLPANASANPANPVPALADSAPPPTDAANPANPVFSPGTYIPPPPSGNPDAQAVPPAIMPPPPTQDYFQSQLAPYGMWVNVVGLGLCWQPAVSPGWRPYYDDGRWSYSNSGWYWQSDYPWGDIAFHYGRWTYTNVGWVWVPGYDYAPAWVVWRQADADGYAGWAPLPPGAVFVNGGWTYHGVHVGVGFDFGLGADYFTFISYDHFGAHDYRAYAVPHDQFLHIYQHSSYENRYRWDNGHVINEGLNRDHIQSYTHVDLRPMDVQDLRRQEEQRNVQARKEDLHQYRSGNYHPNAMRTVGKQNDTHGAPNNGRNVSNYQSDPRQSGQHQNDHP